MVQPTLEREASNEISVEEFADRARAIETEVKSVIVGQDALVRALLARGVQPLAVVEALR